MKTDIVRLKPVNKRYKQLIKEFGDEWVVTKPKQSVQCFTDSKTGIFITSWCGRHSRWVRPQDVEY